MAEKILSRTFSLAVVLCLIVVAKAFKPISATKRLGSRSIVRLMRANLRMDIDYPHSTSTSIAVRKVNRPSTGVRTRAGICFVSYLGLGLELESRQSLGLS